MAFPNRHFCFLWREGGLLLWQLKTSGEQVSVEDTPGGGRRSDRSRSTLQKLVAPTAVGTDEHLLAVQQ